MDRPRHALIIGMPQAGHWTPMRLFILQLAREKVSLTVLCTREQLADLEGLKKDGAFEDLSHVQFWEVFNDRGSYSLVLAGEMLADISAVPSFKDKLISQRSSGQGPTFLVGDMVLRWTQDIADELGIPRYAFFPAPTTFALVVLHTEALLGDEEEWRNKSEESCKNLGFEAFRYRDIPSLMFAAKEVLLAIARYLSRTAGIVINSFEPLETAEAAALRSGLERVVGVSKAPKVYLVGPLSLLPPLPASLSRKEPAPKAANSEIFSFLDAQPARSVLYICFGSQNKLDPASMHELARALELSEVRFLWAQPRLSKYMHKDSLLLPNVGLHELLPAGFISRTEEKGLVWSGWAPQVEILRHPSVGGFLSHCGWNSTLDAIQGGVPVVGWPLLGDQSLNARFLAHVAKVGIQLEDCSIGAVKSNEIMDAIRTLMDSAEGEKYRMRMQELKKSALASVEEGGSSRNAFRDFLQDVSTSS